ncbi:MAG: alpha-D-ribose 1-methylphosphonate 5-phosphate C-P-lyase PhnJ [Dehalococcoidia bacterium]
MFRIENFNGQRRAKCGRSDTYLDEMIDDGTGKRTCCCSDTGFCLKSQKKGS